MKRAKAQSNEMNENLVLPVATDPSTSLFYKRAFFEMGVEEETYELIRRCSLTSFDDSFRFECN